MTEIGQEKCPVAGAVESAVFNGVPIHILTQTELVQSVMTMVRCGHPHVVHFLASDPLTIARRDASFRGTLLSADLNVPDGLPLVWAVRAIGSHATRITASDGLSMICEAGVSKRVRHYFYGSSESTVGLLQTRLVALHPGIEIVGAHSPPFRPLAEEDLARAAQEIRAAGTDVLWIGLGAPKQNVVAETLRRFDAAPVIITIGAAFDFASGVKRRAPAWMQSVGLEWLFRMMQEPRRLGRRYVVGNARFVCDTARNVWLVRVRHGMTRSP